MNIENEVLTGKLTMDWENPKRILFGRGLTSQVSGIVRDIGAKKPVIVSDANVKNAGITDKVVSSLKSGQIPFIENIIDAKEPDMSVALEIARFARDNEFDCVIGVGGGSSLDMAKLMSIMKTNPGDPIKYCALPPDPASDKVKNRGVPEILIPTTSGTGSETSNTLVIIHEGVKTWITSNKILSTATIVDPENTYSCPPNATRFPALDALGHLDEGIVSSLHNQISDGLALQGTSLVNTYLPRAYRNGHDEEARTALSLAATMGGWVLGFPWVGGPATIGHYMAEAFGPKYRMPHGLAVALMLPHVIDFNRSRIKHRMRQLLSAFGEEENPNSDDDVCDRLISHITALMRQVEVDPALMRNTKESKDLLFSMLDYMLNERQFLYNLSAYNPRQLTRDNLEHLFDDLWEGKFTASEEGKER